ncbi:8b6b1964-9f6b-4b76-8ea6-73ca0a4b37d5 [Thermothielavioides terrestris]|uniref:Mediator of RNA polymerase II transcription subunit 5 n=1 Tax=Thermothielavioides terrestris TaxID=2587410 RepID=A0A3S4EXQ2_9PEZI|nr:8b6b1964-9f6b-4b76-8ea6-73ca0a4b37d5 [Thermothielavioides terrestris]
MDAGPATAGLPAAVAVWSEFIRRALNRRLDQEKFAAFVPILFSQHPIPPVILADFILRPSDVTRYSLDPRAFLYLQVLLKQRRLDIASVLRALYKYSSIHELVRPQDGASAAPGDGAAEEKKTPGKLVRWQNSYEIDEILLWRFAKAVNAGTAITTAETAIHVAKVLAKWMPLFTEAAAIFSREAFSSLHGMPPRDETARARNAFALLVFAFSENPVVIKTLSRPAFKGLCKTLSDSLVAFMPCIMQVMPEVAGALELFRTQTLCKFLPSEKKESELNNYMDNLIGLDSLQIPEVPVVNTRAGLYIYLSAALVGRPMLEDSALFTYLHNRYQGDVQSTAVQLILASFDLLANAVFRNEGPRTGHLLKSYVVNKVPLILVSLAASSAVYPFNPEMCITEALGQVDTNVFPTLSGMFEMSNTGSSFHDSVRQDFCFSCQLHGLLSQAAIENLLGDITYQSLPDEGRYVKEILVQSCLQEVDRTQKLIVELDNMNGNVGAAAQAIIEVIGNLCRTKETMTLKQLCSQLAAKPLSLDVLLLFDKPQKILHPLCELLDNWAGYEEDQGEYHPVYEEFGSILLLLLAFVYRYNLSPADLGIRSPDSFVGKLLNAGNLCRPLEELNEREKAHLNGWIHGLFDTEAGGLGDDLMASCSPQDFYLLMPTLFHQVVIALSAGRLTDDMLKCGLEYLVGVLLLPSLVPAILYLSNQLWVGGPQIQTAIIKTLQPILRPSSISHEASTMLSSVLNIVAKPLEHALRSYQRQDPKCQEIEPLLEAIRDNLAVSRRTGGADHTELESWSSMHATNATNGSGITHGGLTAAVRHTVQSLVQWAQQPPLNGMPAAYTHRQTLAALKMLGAKRLLSILLEELKSFADSPQAGIAYDVITAIICAPDVTNDPSLANAATGSPSAADAAASSTNNNNTTPASTPAPQQRRISLREALKAEADDWKKTMRSDPALAETVVRLHRRVEAQMAPPPPPPETTAAAAMLQPELGGLGVDVGADAAALGDAIAAAAAAAGEHHDAAAAAMALDAAGLDAAAGGTVPDLGALGGGAPADLAAQVGAGGGNGGGNGGGGGGGLDLSGDDIFGGLTGASDFGAEFSGWDMDLG